MYVFFLNCVVTGVYVKRIFLDEFGSDQDSVTRIIPLDNFGEVHPDPNLTYAKDLVDKVKENELFDFGAAFDGDGVSLNCSEVLRLHKFYIQSFSLLMNSKVSTKSVSRNQNLLQPGNVFPT